MSLNSATRFVMDDAITKEECKLLLDLAKMYTVSGDGYTKNTSPHTNLEKFEGMSITQANFLVHFGQMQPQLLQKYLQLTEKVKTYVEDYFQLKDLYFSYTHLVCRSALPDSPLNRTDFSHAIHSDNCNIEVNGRCKKEPPAYTWRDYSAILYLNDDFEGGEFMFAKDFYGLNIEARIKPTCGRLIAFTSGRENLHGVNAVKRGTRCAIGLWFTFNKNHTEIEREYSREILKDRNFIT